MNGLVYDKPFDFQQYFSYIVAVSFIGREETGVPGENHRPVASHLTNFISRVATKSQSAYVLVKGERMLAYLR